MPNVPFVVTDSTGNILRSGNVPRRLVAAQARSGETAVEVDGPVNDELEYYDFNEGKVKEIPGKKEELATKRRNSGSHLFF